MQGEGDVDLRGTKTLSDHFYMWSSQSAASKITTFLASKALRGRVDALKKNDFPPVFQHPAFKGSLYKLVDKVIDTQSLLETLRKPYADRIFSIDWQSAHLQKNAQGADIVIRENDSTLTISSQLCVFAAGSGNGELLQKLAIQNPAMQLRPLQQVMVRHKDLQPLYAHCVGTDSKPRLTISSHAVDGQTIWYLGGQLAEEGVHLSAADLIKRAQHEMATLFSWIDWREAEWATLRVDRAEPAQAGLLRPDNAWLSACDALTHCVVAWPTKLTLAPNLGNLLISYLDQHAIRPLHSAAVPPQVLSLMCDVAPAPWQTATFLRSA